MSRIKLIVSSPNRALWLVDLDRRRQNRRNPSRCHRSKGLRLYDGQRAPPCGQHHRRGQKSDAVHSGDPRVWRFPPQDNDLVSQHGVLEDELPTRANDVDPDPQRDAGRRVGSQRIEQRSRSRPKPASRPLTERIHGTNEQWWISFRRPKCSLSSGQNQLMLARAFFFQWMPCAPPKPCALQLTLR